MAKPSSHGAVDWDAVYTAHGQNFLSNTPTDNYFTGNPTLDFLKADAGSYTGGKYLIEPLIHTGQSNVRSVGRMEQASLSMVDPVTAAEYAITEYVAPIAIPALDEVQASGMDARLNLVETYITNARMSAERQLSVDLWATSKTRTTDIDPIPLLITTDGTGTIGNINASTYTFWKNKFIDTVTFSSAGLAKMDKMVNDVSAGNQGFRPGLIVTTQTIYEAYMEQARDANVISTTPGKGQGRIADLGFEVANFRGIPIVWDENCPSGRMYFLNKKGIKMRVLGKGWELLPFERTTSSGIDARVAMLRCFVATTVSHRRVLGQISTIS